ncbi:WhiB family transcriptional regulator [Lentzea sp. CA-135723]|uniref:WhiB family transcriptional regulator n=1 Tax=Lentzea sp. CA-135723 TaxID=3239950 RepID=UPI003D89DC98
MKNWQSNGACTRPGVDPELHFPLTSQRGRLTSPSAIAQAAKAIRMCNGCPVLAPCREWGMTQSDGIWGGLTVQDREAIREGEKRKKSKKCKKSEPLVPAVASAQPEHLQLSVPAVTSASRNRKSVDELLAEIAEERREAAELRETAEIVEEHPVAPVLAVFRPAVELDQDEWVAQYIAATSDTDDLFAKGA